MARGVLFPRQQQIVQLSRGASPVVPRVRLDVHNVSAARVLSSLCTPQSHTLAFKPRKNRVQIVFRAAPVVASWGAEPEWHRAKVLSTTKEAKELQKLYLDVGPEIAAGYVKAGQYIQVKVEDAKAGFFAIASPPDPNNQGVLELLVKGQTQSSQTTAEKLVQLPEGAEVNVSAVQGKGFPVERIPMSDVTTVMLFATGSGISPIKALIESGSLQALERKDVRLYYGASTPAHMAYREAFSEWEAKGVKVIPVYSKADEGYVQDVFEKEGAVAEGASAGAVLCGQKDMCQAVTGILVGKGVEQERILLNF